MSTKQSNMYDWITGTWNPIGGECPHKCSYCYVKSNRRPAVKKKYTGKPYLVEHELKKSLGKNKFWFVCSMIDLFADGIPDGWIYDVIARCRRYNNRYLFQSKNPERMVKYKDYFPENSVLATTIETETHRTEMGLAPPPWHRAYGLNNLSFVFDTMVTIEPIIDFSVNILVNIIEKCRPEWVNIGADSKGHNLPEPSPEKIRALISELKNLNIEVKLKSNLKRLLPEVGKPSAI